MTNDLVEQIVANVLAELQPMPPVRAASAIAPDSSHSEPRQPKAAAVLELDLPILTADELSERLRPGQSLRIGRRTILTPSARDWLQTRKIAWTRAGEEPGMRATSARWQIVATTVTPAVETLKASPIGASWQLLGTPPEAAEFAVRSLCTGDAEGVVGLCGAAATVACLANRNSRVRAAVVSNASEVVSLANELCPNFYVINPRGKSFVELRNLLRAVATWKPREPPQNDFGCKAV